MAATRTFTQLVAAQAAAIQGKAAGLVDFGVGSILRAFTEAVAWVALWLQGLILALLKTTRASTSNGADLDSWMADFGVTRETAIAALGDVTFSRFTATLEATIAAGKRVETTDGSQAFIVDVDTSNPRWDVSRQLYVLPPGVASITVPVVAVTPGVAGNVAVAAVNVISGALQGIDKVTNAASFSSGSDAESDAALRVRFILFISSLSKAINSAIAYAIASLEQNLTHILVENESYDGAVLRGSFYVVVDDGTGTPTAATLSLVRNAIEPVRAAGITFAVFPPQLVDVKVALTLTLASGANATDVKALVSAAIEKHINTLGMGNAVRLTRIAQIAYDASAGVANVTNIMLNAATGDILINRKQRARVETISVGAL